MMTLYMGIDGGGSNLRVVITDENLQAVAQASRSTANPSAIGRDVSRQVIQAAIRETLSQTQLDGSQIAAVAVGVAGASVTHSRVWLIETVRDVLPDTKIVPSSDYEIALVGAHGKREGILLLAGTGSVAFGISPDGRQIQCGGWGYIMGDEGSAYWIGRRALESATQASDGRKPETKLLSAIVDILHLSAAGDLIAWVYNKQTDQVREIALLAPLVMELADQGDQLAQEIIDTAAIELSRLCAAVTERLYLENPAIAFTGGLIATPNRLSKLLLERLAMSKFPQARYSPVIGAALLAKLEATAVR